MSNFWCSLLGGHSPVTFGKTGRTNPSQKPLEMHPERTRNNLNGGRGEKFPVLAEVLR
jgi:hypothetical protein